MINLSAVIITFNEEKNIERCLKSVQGIVDEIVVVDSFSTDKTKSICEKFNATFIERTFQNYSEQKNYANSIANGKYILSLDADEALSEELRKNILIEKKNGFSAKIFGMNRLTNYCGQWIKFTGWYPDKKIRLWQNELVNWQGEIHEWVIFDKKITSKFLKGNILHYSFYTINQHLNQIQYFTDISSRALFEKGKRTNIIQILFSPVVKFIRDYFIKLGFLDGFYGLVISINSAHAKFLKYSKLYQLQKTKKK